MKKNILKIINYFIVFSLGIVLLYFSFSGINFKTLIHHLQTANYFWIFMCLLVSLLSHISRAYRWNLLIQTLDYKPRLRNTFYSVMIGYIANFAFPRLGEVTRCGMLSKKEKIPFDKLIGTVILERAIDLLSLIILLFLVIFTQFNLVGGFFSEYLFIPIQSKVQQLLEISFIIWIVIGIIFISPFVVYFLFRKKLRKLNIYQKFKQTLLGIFSGLLTVIHMKRKWSFLFHTFLIWFCYLISTYFTTLALSSTSHLTIVDSVFILILTSLGMTAPVQGGFGAYHGIVSLGLTLFGISREEGLVYATISHESMTLFIIALGGLSYFLLFLNKKRTNGQITANQ